VSASAKHMPAESTVARSHGPHEQGDTFDGAYTAGNEANSTSLPFTVASQSVPVEWVKATSWMVTIALRHSAKEWRCQERDVQT